jgi:hypothetical protein
MFNRIYTTKSRVGPKAARTQQTVILDAMNITIDKHATLLALNSARKRMWGKDKEVIIALIGQIGTNGGRL